MCAALKYCRENVVYTINSFFKIFFLSFSPFHLVTSPRVLKYFPLGCRAESSMCADTGARNPIGASGIWYSSHLDCRSNDFGGFQPSMPGATLVHGEGGGDLVQQTAAMRIILKNQDD